MARAILLFLVSGAAWAQAPVPWDTLAQVQLVAERNIYLLRFADAVLKLDAKEVKLQGFMLPLNVGGKQTQGRLELVKNDPGAGVFYRLHDAVPAAK